MRVSHTAVADRVLIMTSKSRHVPGADCGLGRGAGGTADKARGLGGGGLRSRLEQGRSAHTAYRVSRVSHVRVLSMTRAARRSVGGP